VSPKEIKEKMKSLVESRCETLYFFDKTLRFYSILCFIEADFFTLQDNARNFLHLQEFYELETFPSENRKYSYLLGRYAAKKALAQHNISISPIDTLIKSGTFRQPVTYCPGKENIQITSSHCGQRAVALTFPETHPMGLDLEITDPNYNSIIETYLTYSEKELLGTIKAFSHDRSCTIFWTVKEALSKALRIGFTSPLEIYEIDNIQIEKNYWVSEFKYFPQYQGYSFSIGDLICSLVYPKHIHLAANNSLLEIGDSSFLKKERNSIKSGDY
jgi:4'-phosphopantetheinyl transferase EntD